MLSTLHFKTCLYLCPLQILIELVISTKGIGHNELSCLWHLKTNNTTVAHIGRRMKDQNIKQEFDSNAS